MDVLFLLVPLSLVLVALIAVALWWAARSGQFEDLEGPAYRILGDDDSAESLRGPREPPPGEARDRAPRESGH